MRHGPQPAKATEVVEWDGGSRRRFLDELAGEEPLEIRVDGRPVSVTMRTPGDDFDLAAGFLFTEGVITAREQIQRISYAAAATGEISGNLVDVASAPGTVVDVTELDRHFFANSSCGICGKASIERILARDIVPPNPLFHVQPDVLARLPDALRSRQRLFGRTGGLHAAALFRSSGELVDIREDIGRHNAVDKIVGHAFLDGVLPLSTSIVMVSGRGGFEIVQKALVAGVPIVACVSAPSSLAVELARRFRLTLVGFLRGTRFVIYSGEHRLARAE